MRQWLTWIRDHKLSTAGLVLVILGCAALVNLSRRVHHLKPRTAASVAAPASMAVASIEAAASLPSQRADAARDARTARMRREFEAAPRYLDFIAQALSRPQEGGKFYALLAWKRCGDLGGSADTAAGRDSSDAFRDAAFALVDAMHQRCAGVTDAYADAPSLYEVAMAQRGGRDSLLPPGGRGIVVPATRRTANADIDAALETGDRWAAAEALRGNAVFLDIGNSTGDDGLDRQLREGAAEIVACELAGTCRRGLEVSLHCVRTGDCAHDDWRDVVLARVPDANRIIFDTMLVGLHERMASVAGRTDTGANP